MIDDDVLLNQYLSRLFTYSVVSKIEDIYLINYFGVFSYIYLYVLLRE